MKKSLLLMPSLIATASMPLVGLVGCDKDRHKDDFITINLDNVESETFPELMSDPFTIEVGKKYRFVIDLSIATFSETADVGLFVGGIAGQDQPTTADYEVTSYIVDTRTITEYVEGEPLELDKYIYYPDPRGRPAMSILALYNENLNNDSHIEIELTFSSDEPLGDVIFVYTNLPI